MTTDVAGSAPLERQVRPHSGDWMTAREAERLAALWCAGQPLDNLPQWRTAMQVLARELSDTRAALKKANDQAEHFERLWYLTNEDAARYAFAKTLEGQVVTMETFKVRGAAELDQALDDAIAEAAFERADDAAADAAGSALFSAVGNALAA